VLSWCRLHMLEDSCSDSTKDELMQTMISIVESCLEHFKTGADVDTLADEIGLIIDLGLANMRHPLSFKLINLSLRFIHRYMEEFSNKECLNKQYLNTNHMLDLLKYVADGSLAFRNALEIIILATFTIPSLNTNNVRIISSRICGDQSSVKNILRVIYECLETIHIRLDNNDVALSKQLLEQFTWWLAALFHCIANMEDNSLKTQFFNGICFGKSLSAFQLILDCYLRKSFATTLALHNLNVVQTLLLSFVSKSVTLNLDIQELSSAFSHIPVNECLLDLDNLRSIIFESTNVNDAKDIIALSHVYASLFLRSLFIAINKVNAVSNAEDGYTLQHLVSCLHRRLEVNAALSRDSDNKMQIDEDYSHHDESISIQVKKNENIEDESSSSSSSEEDSESDSDSSDEESDLEDEHSHSESDSSSDDENTDSDDEQTDSDNGIQEHPKKKQKHN